MFVLQNACGADDPWADYDGVVRGVIEGGCDVGFTKHTTVLEVIQGGTNPQPWATVGAVSGDDIIQSCTVGRQPKTLNVFKKQGLPWQLQSHPSACSQQLQSHPSACSQQLLQNVS